MRLDKNTNYLMCLQYVQKKKKQTMSLKVKSPDNDHIGVIHGWPPGGVARFLISAKVHIMSALTPSEHGACD